jgi:hypothetical protein
MNKTTRKRYHNLAAIFACTCKLVSVKGSFTIDTIFNCYEGDDIKEDEMAHGG